MFRPAAITPLLLASTLLAACSFNPFVKHSPQAAPTIVLKNDNPAATNEASLPQAFGLFQEGEGRMKQGSEVRSLKAVSVSGQDNKAELAFESADGSLTRLSGNLVSRTPNAMIIDFTRSGDADAAGSVRVKYDAAAISSLTGNGTLDGQEFSIEFGQDVVQVPMPPAPGTTLPQTAVLAASKPSASPASSASAPLAAPTPLASAPLELPPIQPNSSLATPAPIELPPDRLVRPDINLSQQGNGLFSLKGQADKSLSSASVMGREDGMVDVVLRFADAEQVRLMGNVEQKDAEAIVINLMDSNTGSAVGRVTVGYNGDHSISTISGDGMLNSQPFSVQFSR